MAKLTALVFVLALCSISMAMETKMTLEMLLQMRAQASGAIDTVMSLLEDLQKASLNERADLDARNKTQEEEGTKQVAELTTILATNEKNYNDAVAHREFIEKEVADTEGHLLWIENRLVEIARKLEELAVQRCAANAMFVNALKEHQDALKAVKLLTQEIDTLHQNGELLQLNSLTAKFQAYGHLFDQNAINSFLELSGVDDITGYQDNAKGELQLKEPTTNPGQRNLKGNLVEKVLNMLKGLSEHLHASMQNLADHEIQAAYDYADFKASSEIENVTLRDDHVRKEKYLAKLEIDVEVARENEDLTLGIRDESQITLDSAVANLEVQREFYAQESARVAEDLSTIGSVIEIFKAKVLAIQGVIKQRIDENAAGDSMTHVTRSAEVDQQRLSGRLDQVVKGQ